jgi:(p)ppGpp synthase/HD superfamily hydrolase
MKDIVTEALKFASIHHAAIGQRRKYTHKPYIVHPIAVADILCDYSIGTVTDEMIAAAYLHDTVEDTDATMEDIVQFGDTVYDYLYWLTDIAVPSDGNRAVRIAKNIVHIANAPAAAQTIKAADISHNVLDIVYHDVNFGRVYVKEKRNMQSVLTKADVGVLKYMDSVLTNAENFLLKL